MIVGEYEGDSKVGKMSLILLFVWVMIGYCVGEIVQVKTPRGNREYEIVTVKFLAIE